MQIASTPVRGNRVPQVARAFVTYVAEEPPCWPPLVVVGRGGLMTVKKTVFS